MPIYFAASNVFYQKNTGLLSKRVSRNALFSMINQTESFKLYDTREAALQNSQNKITKFNPGLGALAVTLFNPLLSVRFANAGLYDDTNYYYRVILEVYIPDQAVIVPPANGDETCLGSVSGLHFRAHKNEEWGFSRTSDDQKFYLHTIGFDNFVTDEALTEHGYSENTAKTQKTITLYPKSYIEKFSSSQLTAKQNILLLLKDYIGHFGLVSRIVKLHWNRQHVAEASVLYGKINNAANDDECYEILQAERSRLLNLKEVNQDGSYCMRLDFAIDCIRSRAKYPSLEIDPADQLFERQKNSR